jgi:hypothetical protein
MTKINRKNISRFDIHKLKYYYHNSDSKTKELITKEIKKRVKKMNKGLIKTY